MRADLLITTELSVWCHFGLFVMEIDRKQRVIRLIGGKSIEHDASVVRRSRMQTFHNPPPPPPPPPKKKKKKKVGHSLQGQIMWPVWA